MSGFLIRRAVATDAPDLQRVAHASKAHWGYDAAFMERVRPLFVFSPERIAEMLFYLAEDAGEVLGFYALGTESTEHWLFDLWVVPAMIGSGLGRRLWEHLVGVARESGKLPFLIESDPNAEGFYLHMGARRVGEVVSEATGRTLPLLRFD